MFRLAFSKSFRKCHLRQTCFYSTKHINKEKQSCSKWQPVIGLEIHAQIAANSKLFSGSAAQFAAPINSQVSAFDAALPGTLPTGYQITQQQQPLATGGFVEYPYYSQQEGIFSPEPRTARLVQLQLEQDSGKSLHDPELSLSLIDLNRAGIGLMEIITEPDFSSPGEAVCFIKELQLILHAIGTCDGRMEEGSLRVDASVSLHQKDTPLGIRAEVKNLNSISAVGKAITYEIERQMEILESGGEIVNETRQFDVETGKTVSLRDKERVHDYRFMPEPNLPPLRLYTTQTIPTGVTSEQIINVDELWERLPELPSAKRARLQNSHGLSHELSTIIMNEPGLVECYEAVVSSGRKAVSTANICIYEMFSALNKHKLSFLDSGLTAEHIGEVVDMITNNVVDHRRAMQVFDVLVTDISKTPRQIVDENCWSHVTDEALTEEICLRVLSENEKAVAQYKRGKTKVINFFIGQVQKELGGRADGKAAKSILMRHLSSDSCKD